MFALRGDELYVVECKAYHARKELTPYDVKKFFTETVPALKSWLRRNNQAFSKCVAEIWTTGIRGGESLKTLDELPRPKGGTDTWGIKVGSDIAGLAPQRIRECAKALLGSIASNLDEGSAA